MFKTLQRRMLYFSIGMFTLVMLLMFIMLRALTFNSVFGEVDDDLKEFARNGNVDDVRELMIDEMDDLHFDFSVELSPAGKIISVFPEETRVEGLEYLISQATKRAGDIEFNSRLYRYRSIEIDGFTFLAFVDATTQEQTFEMLFDGFIVVFVVGMVLLLVVGSVISKRSVRPVVDAFDRQKRFISDASHELKTPLTVMSANLDVLEDNGLSNDQLKWTGYIKDEVKRMSDLTNTLLYLSKMSEEDAVYTKTDISLTEVVESEILSLEAMAFDKGVQVNYTLSNNVVVSGNINQIRSLVRILIDNALKYTEDEQVTIRLTDDKYAVLEVENAGIIQEEDLSHLFDRFYRADKVRNSKDNSFGLGLSIAQEIAQRHKAKLECISKDKTIFKVTFKH